MSLHRFFLTGPPPDAAMQGVELALNETDRHHLARVLRLEAGDRVVLVGTDGRQAEATLVVVSRDEVTADLDSPVARPARPRVSLAAARAHGVRHPEGHRA